MLGRLKFVAFILAVFVLYAMTKGDLGNIRELITDRSYFAVQLAETTRLEKEMLQFRHDAEAFVRGDELTALDDVKLSFDLLWARVNTEATRKLDKRIKTVDMSRQQLFKLADGMRDIDAAVQTLGRHDYSALTRIEGVMRASATDMKLLNEAAYNELYRTSHELVFMQRNAFHSLGRVQWIMLIVGLCGFVVLLWHLRKSELLLAELHEREAEIRELAIIDPLTGLYNRRHFDEQMRTLSEGKWSGHVQLLLVDLDGFKQVNDRYGHEAGDRVLCEVGSRIRTAVEDAAVVARVGGDEFAIIFSGSIERACDIACTIISAVQLPVTHSTNALYVGTSIGISTSQPGSRHSLSLLREADQALYQAKDEGRNRYVVFGSDLAKRHDCRSAA